MTDSIKLNLRLEEQHIVLINVAGQEEKCVLREMSGDDLEAYLESNRDRLDVEIGENGKMRVKSIKSYKGMYSSLLSACLFKSDGEKVTVQEIGKFPHKVQKELFERAQKLNKILGEEETEGN